MRWNKHSRLEGQHAFLGASQYSWLNYDEDKLADKYYNFLATLRGTQLHELAAKLIEAGQDLPDRGKTFDMYVNDAIHYGLKPEQILYYSENCFGTADAIRFDEREYFLRIHDLKTGVNPASIHQLEIYAALFFLEYDLPVNEVEMELRLYQNDDIFVSNPTVVDIAPIMDKIVAFDKLIEQIKKENENGT
jgi:hypothetical protein